MCIFFSIFVIILKCMSFIYLMYNNNNERVENILILLLYLEGVVFFSLYFGICR